MKLIKWENLPENMKSDEVKYYYNKIKKRKISLIFKRAFDIITSLIMIIILSPVLLIISAWIKLDSKGPVFFRQTRVTQYGKEFKIFKFRTMVNNADKIGTAVTTTGDSRITNVGKKIRTLRIDEVPQLFNILTGDMTFVGTRPEVPKYVDKYDPKMRATLLMPAGVTSLASIKFKDEAELLDNATDIDVAYVNEVLPKKMEYNLEEIENYRLSSDLKTMINTVFAVIK